MTTREETAMPRRTKWAVSVDKLKVCLTQPQETFDYIRDHTSYAAIDGMRVLNEDGYKLVVVEEDETAMTVALDVMDDTGEYLRLGTFQFNGIGGRYQGRAFFSFENSSLYTVFGVTADGSKANWVDMLLPICVGLGLAFNNITEIEVALDTETNIIYRLRKLIKDVENYDMYLNGRKVEEGTLLCNYGEYYERSREKLSRCPTLYFKQSKDTDMALKVYDKAKELEERSPGKASRYHNWIGWSDTNRIYRAEVTMHNTNVREFCERQGRWLAEQGEHGNILGLLGMGGFRMAMFEYAADRMVYFRDRTSGERVSITDLLG